MLKNRYSAFILLIGTILAIFVPRTWLAKNLQMPQGFHLFDILTVAGALAVLWQGAPFKLTDCM